MEKTFRGPSQIRWWQGARGEWYVVAQALLAVVVLFGPRTCEGWPAWGHPCSEIAAIAGVALCLMGGLLFAAAVFNLGSNFTAVPFPKDDATLVDTGAYRFVRHPMYSGAVMAALGWALLVHGWLTIGYAAGLFLFFDIKSRREERWLIEKFSGYESYRRRVRKLIPYID